MKKGPFYEVKVKIQNLKACISRAPAIFGTKTLWQSFHTILSNSWKNGGFCIIFRCFFALTKMFILLHKMEIVRILFLLSVFTKLLAIWYICTSFCTQIYWQIIHLSSSGWYICFTKHVVVWMFLHDVVFGSLPFDWDHTYFLASWHN